MDALTRYHYAKEREENAVLYINDAYLEALNSLENLEAENARLREELADAPKCETCEAMLDCDECLRADGSHKERRRLSAENAKLRELAKGMYGMLATCDAILGNHYACETPRPLIFGENKSFKDAMCELSVKVDE